MHSAWIQFVNQTVHSGAVLIAPKSFYLNVFSPKFKETLSSTNVGKKY